MRSVLAVVSVAVLVFSIGGAFGHAQNSRTSAPIIEWPTYGGNLASHRYSPADQITKDNFNTLQIAWRLKTDFLGPRPDTLYSATPLLIDRVLYTTAGTRRAAVALNAATGEMLWMHTEDEGARGENAPRIGAGRGLAYWAGANGADRRVIYVTPGYRMLALDARTGVPIPSFGRDGAVDLKLEDDQDVNLDTTELGLNATPLVVGDVIVVGAAHRPGASPRTMRNAKGYVRGYDVRTGKRLWIFHTIPRPGQVRLRHVAGRFGREQRQHRRVGANERRPRARSRLRACGNADRRLLRRQPSRQHAVRRKPRRARLQDRSPQVALPDRAPRRLGLRPAMRADPVRHDRERPHDQGTGAANQTGVPLCLES